jgi:shikimate dehydrogenase
MTLPAERYAVFGHPIAHSLSPWIHAQFAQQTAQALSYTAIDVAPAELAVRLPEFFAQDGRGLNITVPHKQMVIALLDSLSERARIAGAVNTVVWRPDQRLHGDNTDGIGFVRDLTQNLKVSISGRRVLLLGAGGAARGLLAPLLALELEELVIANRSVARAEALVAAFKHLGPIRASGFEELQTLDYALIVNATAASLQAQVPPLPPGALDAGTVCYDLAYGHAATPFVHWALEQGSKRAYMGIGMLVEQAAESFSLWRGVHPQTAAVLAALRAGAADSSNHARQH